MFLLHFYTGAFNNQTCNSFSGRESIPENMEQITNILCYSNIQMSVMCGLINKSAAIPFEINPVILSYMDWLFFYANVHTSGLLQYQAREGYKRMVGGYESRQVCRC